MIFPALARAGRKSLLSYNSHSGEFLSFIWVKHCCRPSSNKYLSEFILIWGGFPLFHKMCSSSCHQRSQISAFLFVMILSCLVLSRLSLPMLFYPPNKSCRALLVSLTDDLTGSIQRFQMPECQQLLLGNLSQESFKWTGPSMPLSTNNCFRMALGGKGSLTWAWPSFRIHDGEAVPYWKYYRSTQNECNPYGPSWGFVFLFFQNEIL